MNSKAPIKLLPVLRRPRREWQIPLFETPANRKVREEKEARIRALTAGTTPYGREIFRRTVYLAERLVEAGKGSLEVIKRVEEQIRMFPELHAEFVLLLGRIGEAEGEPVQLEGTTPLGWAGLMVLQARREQKFKQQLAASTNHESDEIAPTSVVIIK